MKNPLPPPPPPFLAPQSSNIRKSSLKKNIPIPEQPQPLQIKRPSSAKFVATNSSNNSSLMNNRRLSRPSAPLPGKASGSSDEKNSSLISPKKNS